MACSQKRALSLTVIKGKDGGLNVSLEVELFDNVREDLLRVAAGIDDESSACTNLKLSEKISVGTAGSGRTMDEIDDNLVLCTVGSRFRDPTSTSSVHLDVRKPFTILLDVGGVRPDAIVGLDAVEEDSSLGCITPREDELGKVRKQVRQRSSADLLHVSRKPAEQDVVPEETEGTDDDWCPCANRVSLVAERAEEGGGVSRRRGITK